MTFAAISIATTIATTAGGLIAKNRAEKKANREARALNRERDAELAQNKIESQKTINAARALVKEGDPTLAAKQRQIDQSASDVVGKAVSTSGSTQEIINAAQAVQSQKDSAENLALSQAGQFKTDAKKFLAGRFGAAGQLRLQGSQIINQQAQAQLAAISASAQAGVDSFQNVTGNLISGFGSSIGLGQGGGSGISRQQRRLNRNIGG